MGRIGRPHGIRGEVSVEVRTDDPERRFAIGAVLLTDPDGRGPLTVEARRWHSGRLLVSFAGSGDRTDAERLRDTMLLVEVDLEERFEDPEEYHDHQLVGLRASDPAGQPIGEVTDVLHLPGQDLLAVRRTGGEEVLVPFVAALVPTVDLAAGHLVIDPPPGLLDG